MPLNLEEFSRPRLQGYVENIPPAREYLLAGFMPEEQTDDIEFAYGVITGRYGEAASITGWNASAPLRDFDSLAQAFGSLSKLQHAKRLDEVQLLRFNRPRSDAERNRVVEYVYDVTDSLSYGVDDMEEYLRAQAIYTGRLTYDDDLNDIHIDIDFGTPVQNRLTATLPWDSPDATPLQDLEAAAFRFREANVQRDANTIHMNRATEAMLLRSEEIRTQVYGVNNGGRLLTRADLQNAFNGLGLPNYVVNNDAVVINGETVNLLPDRTVALLGNDLGTTYVGPTVENNYNPGKFVQPKVEVDPPSQTVIVGKAVFPALKRPTAVVTLSV